MGCIQLDLRGALSFLSEREIRQMELAAETAKGELVAHTGAGNDFHGWVDLPEAYDREEFARIQKAAAKIQAESEILVVAGIGGSYLGARGNRLPAPRLLQPASEGSAEDAGDLFCRQQHERTVYECADRCNR